MLIGCQDEINVNNIQNSNSEFNKITEEQNNEIIFCDEGRIGGKMWIDLDRDGIRDADEITFEGITVCLFMSDGTWLDNCTITDNNGNYSFKNLPMGYYKVKINIPEGWTISPNDQGSDDLFDSDFYSSGFTLSFKLYDSEKPINQDAGLYQEFEFAQIGDRIWNDLNQNGIQDIGENGLSDITLCLFKCDGTWLNMCTTTDANGNYQFPNLEPGEYKVAMNIPDGWSLSPQNIGDDETDSDFESTVSNPSYSDCITLESGVFYLTCDGGLYLTPPPLGQIGDRVWNDMNQNGIQDVGEEGLSGITICLFGCDGTSLNNCAETDIDGYYVFKDIQPGLYKMKINIPDSWKLSPLNQGTDDSKDSDFGSDTYTECFEIISGEENSSLDAGLFYVNNKTSGLGDRVWYDKDKDGIQDRSEDGISNVVVELYDCNNNLISTTTTNSDGNYYFGELSAGDYKLKFIAPSGLKFTKQDQRSDEEKDSDVDANGYTKCISLPDNTIDLTWDAGLRN